MFDLDKMLISIYIYNSIYITYIVRNSDMFNTLAHRVSESHVLSLPIQESTGSRKTDYTASGEVALNRRVATVGPGFAGADAYCLRRGAFLAPA